MGTQDNKLEERGLPRDSCLLLKCPHKGIWGRELINMKKSTQSVDFYILINECPHDQDVSIHEIDCFGGHVVLIIDTFLLQQY
jgi:hypothetical protein